MILVKLRYIIFFVMTAVFAGCAQMAQWHSIESEVLQPDPRTETVDPKIKIEDINFNKAPCADIQCFKQTLLSSEQFNPQELRYFFANLEYKPNIIKIMQRPGTSRPWYVFQKNNVTDSKINYGKKFLQQHLVVAKNIEKKYDVPKELLIAILGIETNYGQNMGNFRVADALSTLAFNYPKRAGFFQQELYEFLLMTQEKHLDPFSLQGSYAGAMGMPQFMPSSYRIWADSYELGVADIWHNEADALASIANYLKYFGWQAGKPISIPVTLELSPELEKILKEKTNLEHKVVDLKALGVTPLVEVDDEEPAFLYSLEISPGNYQYFIGLNNFYPIWKYNNSRLYVHAVKEIMDGIAIKK